MKSIDKITMQSSLTQYIKMHRLYYIHSKDGCVSFRPDECREVGVRHAELRELKNIVNVMSSYSR